MSMLLQLIKKVAYFPIYNIKSDIIESTMSDLQFVEENDFHIKSRRLLGEPTTPSMVRFLLRTGVVKTEKQALIFLIIFVVIVIILTIYLANVLLVGSSGDSTITDRFGNEYTAEEYFELLGQGKDPLSPNFTP